MPSINGFAIARRYRNEKLNMATLKAVFQFRNNLYRVSLSVSFMGSLGCSSFLLRAAGFPDEILIFAS